MANVRHGKLVKEPESLMAAYEQLWLAEGALEVIKKDLKRRPERMTKFPTMADYDRWRDSAKGAQRLYHQEVTLLRDFITKRQAEADAAALFGPLYELVKDLQADEVEFRPEEEQLIAKCDALFADKLRKSA